MTKSREPTGAGAVAVASLPDVKYEGVWFEYEGVWTRPFGRWLLETRASTG
jgi:hypothetical protein